jgi:hypothetical protein
MLVRHPQQPVKENKMKHNSSLEFAGVGAGASNKPSMKYAGNQCDLTMKENYGRGPTHAGSTGHTVPNPTARSGKIDGGTQVKMPGNADKIHFGK